MSTKATVDMSDDELFAELSMLRDRRKQRAESAAAGHRTKLDPTQKKEPKAKREKVVDVGLQDMLSAILEGNFDMPSPEASGDAADSTPPES